MLALIRLVVVCCLIGCGTPKPVEDAAVDYAAAGPWTPARTTSSLLAGDRALSVEAWYPADVDPGAATSILDLVVDPADRGSFEALLAAAPAGCPARTTRAVVGAPVASGGPWPLILMSHCHGCTRFSTVTVAEHLASHGFVVVAPDHAGNTLFDELAGTGLPLDTDTLALRAADLRSALDAALAGALPIDVPVDPGRVGVLGHSFGAVTAGVLLQEGIGTAGMFIGAPPDNPLLAGVSMESLAAPLLFEVLAEDHSVGAAGNLLIEANYAAAPGPAWLVEVSDGGHWSPSDLVGLTEGFMPGCGDDTRESDGAPFSYVPPAEGRALTASVAAAFFAQHLSGESGGGEWLAGGDARLSVESR